MDKKKLMFRSIKSSSPANYTSKSSKFIALAFHIDEAQDAKNIIKEHHQKYFDATHLCYGLVIDDYECFSDDGEPSGTAGLVILNQIKSAKLDHTLIIVIRYFGHHELGKKGLIEAYQTSAKLAISNSAFANYQLANIVEFTISFSEYSRFLNEVRQNKLKVINVITGDINYIVTSVVDDDFLSTHQYPYKWLKNVYYESDLSKRLYNID
jgi:putative IMPACT (imprinted ancient) family translation regulator